MTVLPKRDCASRSTCLLALNSVSIATGYPPTGWTKRSGLEPALSLIMPVHSVRTVSFSTTRNFCRTAVDRVPYSGLTQYFLAFREKYANSLQRSEERTDHNLGHGSTRPRFDSPQISLRRISNIIYKGRFTLAV